MKQAVLNLLASGGAFAPFRKANRHKALILMYHRFSQGDDAFSTSARAFRQQLEYLRAHYTLTTVSHLARHFRDGEEVPSSLAAITIDDGFSDAYEIALPLLKRYDAPATVFVVTDFVDQRSWIWTDKARFLTFQTRVEKLEISVAGHAFELNLNGPSSRLEAAARINERLKLLDDTVKDEAIASIAAALKITIPELPPAECGPLTWEQAREMHNNGVEIASHTLTHPILTNIPDKRLRTELQQSRRRVAEMIGHDSGAFCYPNGNYDKRVIQEVERAGYQCAVSTEPGLNSKETNFFSLKRIPAISDLARFVKASSGFELAQARLRSNRPRSGVVK
jgi:peptidoglycan/xylan/chitin deacetylase (PgdA/CDA1 family)